MTNNENAVSFDYKTIKVKREMETMTADAYEALGWRLCGTSGVEGSIFYVNMSFKRDRKITNKPALLKLQAQVDATLAEIETAQAAKKNAGTSPAIAIGTIGALVLGGGMSLVMTLGGMLGYIGGIALGLVGIGICVANYSIFRRIRTKKHRALDPVLEESFNKLGDLCEEANNVQK